MAEPVFAVDSDPSSSVIAFFQALRTGDSTTVDSLISEEALSSVQVLLNSLEQMADSDPEGATARLAAAGYGVDSDEVEDWDARDYLNRTVALPVMMARYIPYEMSMGEPAFDDDRVRFPLTFTTSGGFSLESEAVLDFEDDVWKVTGFLGLNSFP